MKFRIIAPYEALKAADLDANTTLGIEVTVPAIAEKCGRGNIDHHGPGCDSTTPSACEQALKFLENPGMLTGIETVIGCVPDSDTITAMAVIKLIKEGNGYLTPYSHYESEEVVKLVGLLDRVGPSSATDPEGRKLIENEIISAIVAVSGSRSLSLEEKIEEVSTMIVDIRVTDVAMKEKAEGDRAYQEAVNASTVEVLPGGVVYVESTHQSATRIGYEHGDVLICYNHEMKRDFKDASKGTYRKYTVCKRDENVPCIIDYKALNNLEQGWGGRSTVGGSPQGLDSKLTKEDVLSCLIL